MGAETLFHVSEEPTIACFEPRPSKYTAKPVVWAISEARLPNYLLPRDCPRVTFYANERTTAGDRQRFLGGSALVVALEHSWYQRLRRCLLYAYRLPAATFQLQDATAGYYVSDEPVVPLEIIPVPDVIQAQFAWGVELRFLANLWPLADAVIASSLAYSCIRLRHARPRPDGAAASDW